MNTLFQSLRQAIKTDVIDQAIIPIQETLGQQFGDDAGLFFSGRDIYDTWPKLTTDQRLALLIEYVSFELTNNVLG